MASTPEWSNLPHDLVGRVLARLPFPGLRAGLRAVCRSWHSAVRLHVSPRPLPWVVFSDGSFSTPLDSSNIHHLPFLPKNTRCIGSTNDWLALDCTDEVTQTHAYSLHNPFTGATVPLPELDSIIGKVPATFEIRKVLMRSTPDDLVAVTCNIWRCPLILCRPGKGAWMPRLATTMPYSRIIDLAFVGDKLYAITKAEDLFALHVAEDADGKPIISTVKRIISHAPGHDDDMYNDGVGMGLTDIDASNDEDNREELDDEDDEDNENDENDEALDEQDNYDMPSQQKAHHESADDDELSDCEEGVNRRYDAINTARHLVESHGKLLMVRREWLCSAFTPTHHTRKAEVFEADVDTGTWVPVASGLGGHAIFANRCFSRLVPACGEVEKDLIYFPCTNDVFDMRTRAVRPLGAISRLDGFWRVWLFPPDLVV